MKWCQQNVAFIVVNEIETIFRWVCLEFIVLTFEFFEPQINEFVSEFHFWFLCLAKSIELWVVFHCTFYTVCRSDIGMCCILCTKYVYKLVGLNWTVMNLFGFMFWWINWFIDKIHTIFSYDCNIDRLVNGFYARKIYWIVSFSLL